MATAIDIFSLTAKANADLSAKQFYGVKLTAADVVDVPSAATDIVIGILQNAPKANAAASVQVLGISKAVSDGSGTTIVVGDRVGPSSTGLWVKKATNDYNAGGIALDGSTANGTVIRVLLTPAALFRTLAG